MKHTGSRAVELSVTRYYGGEKVGRCFKFTGEMEDGRIGYVQLNKKDIKKLIKIAEIK